MLWTLLLSFRRLLTRLRVLLRARYRLEVKREHTNTETLEVALERRRRRRGPLVDYVTAGYSFAFGGLALYALSIWWRGAKPLTDTKPRPHAVAPPRSKSSSRRRTIGVLVVLALAILALLSQGLLHSLNYFDTVDQVFASRAKIGTTTIVSRAS